MTRYTRPSPLIATASSVNIAATASSGGGANAVLNFAAPAASGQYRCLEAAYYGYDGDSTGGRLNVYAGTTSGVKIFELDAPGGGPHFLDFGGLRGTVGVALAVELLQGGSSFVGRINAYSYVE